MKIGNIEVKISILAVAVFVIFTLFLLGASLYSTEVRSQLFWMIPGLFLLLVIPMALNAMSHSQYEDIAPVYEAEAKTVRIRMVNENMIGKPVRIEGVVEKVRFRFLNRPQFVVADRSGEISVKMFTSPNEDIHENDVVEVLGMVIRRYVAVGDPVINCVSIRRTDKKAAPARERG